MSTTLARRASVEAHAAAALGLACGDPIAINRDWRTLAVVEKFDGDWPEARRVAEPRLAEAAMLGRLVRPDNLLLIGGGSLLWQYAIGNGGADTARALLNNANAFIGVGDTGTAPASTQTDLQASISASRTYKAMDTSYPLVVFGTSVSGTHNRITFRSTFGPSDANYAWNEWVVKNNGSFGSGTTLNRKADSLGTKVNTATWVLTVTIDLG